MSKAKKNRVLHPGDSFTCECGKVHPLGVYVSAHWLEVLVHTCDCGRRHSLHNGMVKLMGKSTTRRAQT